jgi:glycosyltransferase involved in cell wall biosynthesis
MPKFSICMTNYNTADVLRKSMDSILSKINTDEFEIIIVDSNSTDGSLEILKEYQKKFPNFTIIEKKCLRGRGRQIAFEHSKGDIIITADNDTVYNDLWMKVIRYHEKNRLDYGLSMLFSQVYPRKILEEVGGWKNLQYLEDAELWSRLAKIGKYHTYPVVPGENLKRAPRSTPFERTYRIYRKMHDRMAIFTHIPLYMYLNGYNKELRKNYRGKGYLLRFVYYSSLLIVAKMVSSLRRVFVEYGDVEYTKTEKVLIDLKLTETENLKIEGQGCDTFEDCVEAYKKGDFGFLPGFYD